MNWKNKKMKHCKDGFEDYINVKSKQNKNNNLNKKI